MPKNTTKVAEGGHQISGIPVESVKNKIREQLDNPVATVEVVKPKRVRKPKSETPKTNLDDVVNTLKDWADWAGANGEYNREARKYYDRRRRLGSTNAGDTVMCTTTGKKAQVIEQFAGNSTKVVDEEGRSTTWAPAAEIELVPADEFRIRSTVTKTENKTTVVKVKTENKKVENKYDIPVEVTDKGHVKIFGQGACNLLYWAGAQGWDKDNIESLKVELGLDRLAAENSIKNGLKIGAKTPADYEKIFTPDQKVALETAAGRAIEVKEEPKVEEPKKVKTITKKDLKRVGK